MRQMVDLLSGQLGNNLVALSALLLSFTVFFISILRDWKTDRRSNRIERSTAYLQLEMYSSEAFRYLAENSHAMKLYKATERGIIPQNDEMNAQITKEFYYQCLNLFEVCSNFRKNGVIDKIVYASWVSWFHEILDQWYFRELWVSEMRDNYTPDIRNIFDLGIKIYGSTDNSDERLQQFYEAVSHLMGGCSIIRNWLDTLYDHPEWPPLNHGQVILVRQTDEGRS